MYAIVEIAGKQFRVQENDLLYVPRLQAEADSRITVDRVLLVSNDEDIRVGAPTVDGATVSATVLRHLKGDKVLVFKKKRRKRFKVMRGHRQQYTQLKIDAVALGNASKGRKAAASKEQESAAAVEA